MQIVKGINITNEDNMELMSRYEDNHFDLAIVDPPYGLGVDKSMFKDSNTKRGKSKSKRGNYKNKNWDNKRPDKKYFDEFKRVSKNVIIWGANHFIENIPNANSSCWIVWNKENGNNGYADCELAFSTFKSAVRKIDLRWHGMLQQDMKNKEIRIHPTQKPIKLYEWVLMNYAKPGDKILDTHLGSGSIAIACHERGFELTACELDKEYFDSAIKRIKIETSQQSLF